jgi:hypothetical protein
MFEQNFFYLRRGKNQGIDIVHPQNEKGGQEGLLACHSEPPQFPSGVDSFYS